MLEAHGSHPVGSGARGHCAMTDLRDSRLIYFKAGLFLLGGCLAAGLVFAEQPSLRVAALLVIAIWCFCRAYYFAFYVIEHYVDPSYKFAGLGAFVRYLWRRRMKLASSEPGEEPRGSGPSASRVN